MEEVRHRTRRALDIPPRKRKERVRPEGTRRTFRVDDPSEEDPHIAVLKAAQSQQIDDPFRDHIGAIGEASGLQVVEPPYNMGSLLRLPRENNILRQCIDAMVTNIDGHGWRLEYVGPEGQEESPAANDEDTTLDNLLRFPNDDHSLQELRERLRRDIETTGNAYVEIGRDRKARIVFMAHVPAHTVRMTNKDPEPVDVEVILPREGEARIQRVTKTFRRFVQLIGARRMFFKEFGDPRPINPRTGRVDEAVGIEQEATELLHFRLYTPGTPYGVPRWINQLPSILGSRQAELTNLDFFKENAIPAMALLVSGGMVPQGTIDDIEGQFLAARGRKSFNRILVIEAYGDEDAASQDGTVPVPRMEIKPLRNERQKDALFQEYDKSNMSKVRSAFRLPPIFLGMAQEYTHATAKTSFEVAESQVFGPERSSFDDTMNMKILSTYDPQFWSFRSLPARISDPEDVINALTAFDDAGALTPNVAIGLANDFFDLEIPAVEASWGDFPFDVVLSLVDKGVVPEGMEDLLSVLPSPDELSSDDTTSDEGGPTDSTSVAPPPEAVEEVQTMIREALGELSNMAHKVRGAHPDKKRRRTTPQKPRRQRSFIAVRHRSRAT